jgi:hypothetical protein
MLRNPNKGDFDMLPAPEEHMFVRSRTVVSRVVGGETLIVPVRGKVGDLASIYSFNGTGTLIWQLLDSPRELAELTDAVEREYAVQPEQAHQDVTRFLQDMYSVGLVEARPRVAMPAIEMAQAAEPQHV